MNPRRDYFDGLAQRWDALPSPPDAGEKANRFVRAAVRNDDRRVLDVGSGTGILVEAMRGLRVVECDLAEGMLRESRHKWGAIPEGWVCADALIPPFKRVFDTVLCFGVLPHLGDPREALRALITCLRPGGGIAIGHMMSSDELNAFHGQLDGPVKHDRIVPVPDLAAILESLGGRITAAEESPGWYFVRAEF